MGALAPGDIQLQEISFLYCRLMHDKVHHVFLNHQYKMNRHESTQQELLIHRQVGRSDVHEAFVPREELPHQLQTPWEFLHHE
jgi:hypothetical protein